MVSGWYTVLWQKVEVGTNQFPKLGLGILRALVTLQSTASFERLVITKRNDELLGSVLGCYQSAQIVWATWLLSPSHSSMGNGWERRYRFTAIGLELQTETIEVKF